jgi:hypothetical protein
MSAKTTNTLIVLFEDEVRLAAKLVKALVELPQDCSDAEYSAAARDALNACIYALAGADNENASLLLGRKPTPPQEGK